MYISKQFEYLLIFGFTIKCNTGIFNLISKTKYLSWKSWYIFNNAEYQYFILCKLYLHFYNTQTIFIQNHEVLIQYISKNITFFYNFYFILIYYCKKYFKIFFYIDNLCWIITIAVYELQIINFKLEYCLPIIIFN